MIGKTISSRYGILEKLGEGGMREVYKARDTHLVRFVAIKALLAEKVADPERMRRFVQEAKAASALNHPNIITIYDTGSESATEFIRERKIRRSTSIHLPDTFLTDLHFPWGWYHWNPIQQSASLSSGSS